MTADWFIVLLLLIVGLAMLLTEIFLVGIFVIGILGIIFMVGGVVMAYGYFGNEIGMSVLFTSILLTSITLYHALRQETWKFMALSNHSDSDFETPTEDNLLILGQEGITISALRPIGTAQFGNDTFEVRTFGKYLDNNSIVYIAKIDRRKIYVEPIEAIKAS